ncbi:MAG: succinate dehydrogenase assembly factor 2 [Gammaproteobacteria bacterium]|nr:succinate dehydrogenase assembly factor 2 [Gammaproteobacteria bacterium]NNC76890.1 succinate dehydrogenase assembly factor 2 [Woeseiaceae bacterium]
MRELDDLLMRWIETRYDNSTAAEISAFESLLALPDPEISAYLLKRQTPSIEAHGLIVRQILDTDSAG